MIRVNRRRQFRRPLLTTTMLVAPLAAALSLPGAVLAQDQGGQDEAVVVGEIIVTARRRSEALQEVPAAVSALSEHVIERAGVRDISDVAALTPGLTFTALQGSNMALPVIRGLSTNVGESNVGFFIDGVYQGSRSGMDRVLADVERIEVIKGPQVALYGRNAFGGAINVITRAPDNTPSARAALTLGEGGRFEAQGSVSGPLVRDRLYGRIGVSHAERDGFYTNELTGDDLDSRRTTLVSGALLFEATPDLTFDLRAAVEETRNGDSPGYFLLNNNPVLFNGRSQIYLGEVPAKRDGFAVTPGRFERDSSIFSLTTRWNISDRYTFSAITSYNTLETLYEADNDFQAESISFQTQRIDLEEFSQEFRIDYSGDDFDWLAGVYYSNQETNTFDQDLVTNPAIEAALPASQRSTLIDNDETATIYALFGSATWRFAPSWSATFAARWFREERSVDPYQTNPYTGIPLSPNPPLYLDNEFFIPSFTLEWDYRPNLRFYGSIAQGVKSGGFNTLANVTADERIYDAEQSWNYELGVKSELFGGRVLANASVFLVEWEDQIVRALGTLGATLNANAGRTQSSGFEVDVRARATQHLSVGFSYAYTDAHFKEYIFQALQTSFGLDPDQAGNSLQFVSRHVATANFDYQAPLAGNWEWFARGDLSYRSRQYGITTNQFWTGDVTRANLTVGVENGPWTVEVWGRNLLDDDTPTMSLAQRNRASLVLPPAGQGVFRTLAYAPEPRNFGVTLRYRY